MGVTAGGLRANAAPSAGGDRRTAVGLTFRIVQPRDRLAELLAEALREPDVGP